MGRCGWPIVPGFSNYAFLSSPWSGFRQLSTVCKSDDLTVPKFEKLQSSFTTDLCHHESCLIQLALEKLNRRQVTTVARP